MDHAPHDSHPHVRYWMVFVALCICTAISAGLDLVELPASFLVFGVLAVATAKALFVMTYFMHLKFEGRWKFIILMPTAILAVGLMVALAPDMAMHYYEYDVMQSKLVKQEVPHGAGHGAGHSEGHGDDHGDEDHAEDHSADPAH